MELALDLSSDMSVRAATRRLNRMRLENKGIIPTTYRNLIEREGKKIQEHLETKCEEALVKNGFNMNGEAPKGYKISSECIKSVKTDDVKKAAEKLNVSEYELTDYELPETTISISADEVGVKRQTAIRPRPENSQQPKRVDNTVIHVQNENGKYILNAATLLTAIKLLIGFLLQGGHTERQLVVFADGARDIHNAVCKMLSFANVKIILDWYHLKKKCKEQLSMALKGSEIRNKFLAQLLPCLWYGNISGAISLLKNIDQDTVKNSDYITSLIEYFERVRVCVPCYALRKELGLRNSSNLGEKSNDLVVSHRQKHNGMSWSNDGSIAFATVSATIHNNEINNWIYDRSIDFSLCEDMAA
jgi:hypothetical protein